MGYTAFSKEKIELIIPMLLNPEYVIDLGAQNDYSGPNLPAPYISEWYKEKGLLYESIDLSGENNCEVSDLSIDQNYPKPDEDGRPMLYDLVVDAGTSEHVGKDGKFSWEAYYNCWLNKWNLLKVGGVMYSENPMTGNWPYHGFNYIDCNFYYELCKIADCSLMDTGTHVACHNTTDGWNVWGAIRKLGHEFMSLDQFKTLPIKQS